MNSEQVVYPFSMVLCSRNEVIRFFHQEDFLRVNLPMLVTKANTWKRKTQVAVDSGPSLVGFRASIILQSGLRGGTPKTGTVLFLSVCVKSIRVIISLKIYLLIQLCIRTHAFVSVSASHASSKNHSESGQMCMYYSFQLTIMRQT